MEENPIKNKSGDQTSDETIKEAEVTSIMLPRTKTIPTPGKSLEIKWNERSGAATGYDEFLAHYMQQILKTITKKMNWGKNIFIARLSFPASNYSKFLLLYAINHNVVYF